MNTHGVSNTCYLFHNGACANASQCCVVRTLLFMLGNSFLLLVIYTAKTSPSIIHYDGEEIKMQLKNVSYIYQFHSKDMCSRKSCLAPAGLRAVGPQGRWTTGLCCRIVSRLGCPCLWWKPNGLDMFNRNPLLLVRGLWSEDFFASCRMPQWYTSKDQPS